MSDFIMSRVIATGYVVVVSGKKDSTLSIERGDSVEAGVYRPTETQDPHLPAGLSYNIFQVTSPDRNGQSMLYFNTDEGKWQDFLRKDFRHGTVNGLGVNCENTLKKGDTFKVSYQKGMLTWDVWRGKKAVATFSCRVND